MEKINPNSKQVDQSRSIGDLKVWKMPILTQLDIKQTLTGGCPSGQHPVEGPYGPVCEND